MLPSNPDKKARATANKQTKKSLAFMPEWSHVQTCLSTKQPPFVVGNKLKTTWQHADTHVPAAAHKVTKKMIAEKGEEKQSWEIAFGAPWTAETFIQEATNRGHPASLFEGLAPMVLDAIHNNSTRDFAAIAQNRASFLKKWTTRAAQLTKRGGRAALQHMQAQEAHHEGEKNPCAQRDAGRAAVP